MDCELSAATACVKVCPIKHKAIHLLQTLMTRKGLDINAIMLEWIVSYLITFSLAILCLAWSGSITKISNVYEKHDSAVYSSVQVKLALSSVLSTFLEFPQNLFPYAFADTHFWPDLWFGSKWLQWLSYRIMSKTSAKWYQLWFSSDFSVQFVSLNYVFARCENWLICSYVLTIR